MTKLKLFKTFIFVCFFFFFSLVVNGLSSLIERNIEIIDQHNDDDDETIELQAARTNIAAIAPFAKNFLPLLVNTVNNLEYFDLLHICH